MKEYRNRRGRGIRFAASREEIELNQDFIYTVYNVDKSYQGLGKALRAFKDGQQYFDRGNYRASFEKNQEGRMYLLKAKNALEEIDKRVRAITVNLDNIENH